MAWMTSKGFTFSPLIFSDFQSSFSVASSLRSHSNILKIQHQLLDNFLVSQSVILITVSDTVISGWSSKSSELWQTEAGPFNISFLLRDNIMPSNSLEEMQVLLILDTSLRLVHAKKKKNTHSFFWKILNGSRFNVFEHIDSHTSTIDLVFFSNKQMDPADMS